VSVFSLALVGTHPLAGEMRCWMVAAGDEVVGHLTAVPLYYRINGQRVVVHRSAEWHVLTLYGRHAVYLFGNSSALPKTEVSEVGVGL
jgi:hypothetical protein